MRIAFGDFCNMDFHVQTVDSAPLGGSQSAACYLARELARLGHEVFFISALSAPGIYDGVVCLKSVSVNREVLESLRLDAFVCLLAAGRGTQLRNMLGARTRLILWNQHAADQPGVAPLHDPRQKAAFDGFAMVSRWQRDEFLRIFELPAERTVILRNAIAPVFADQFDAAPILPRKAWPPILAYTSTPFRGLELLLEAFPDIAAAIPGARLLVFSSMKVYGNSAEEDLAEFGRLYQRCRETAGVEYIGSAPQPELARALRDVLVLAYPNNFAETSCIAVMEAMASGCFVVTSDLAALPETTGGFARLVSVAQGRQEYLGRFVEQIVDVLHGCGRRGEESEWTLRRQVDQMNSGATWEVRAREWVRWLESLSPRGGAG